MIPKEDKSFSELSKAQAYQKKMRLEHPDTYVGIKIRHYRDNMIYRVYIKHWINGKWQ